LARRRFRAQAAARARPAAARRARGGSTGGTAGAGGRGGSAGTGGEYYESVGNSFLTTNIFDGGTTHFIKAARIEMATLIVGEVRKNNGRLASYLK
jgi:hypothetical protein